MLSPSFAYHLLSTSNPTGCLLELILVRAIQACFVPQYQSLSWPAADQFYCLGCDATNHRNVLGLLHPLQLIPELHDLLSMVAIYYIFGGRFVQAPCLPRTLHTRGQREVHSHIAGGFKLRLWCCGM